uniref:Uncharacterized protein n=1 Tax=Oryza nivara TaxID=4536 RepID=A0A0E0I9C6_ORYNI
MATMRERVEEAAAKALGNLDPVVPNLLETRSSIPYGEAAADNLRAVKGSPMMGLYVSMSNVLCVECTYGHATTPYV